MPHSPDDLRQRLCALGEHLRALTIGARGVDVDMAKVEGETSADTIYAIDRIVDDQLVAWFERHWTGVEIVSEGLEDPVVVGSSAEWTVIVDTIDGTRGLMYDKRPAWALAAAAPAGGRSGDIAAAAMTELPTVKQSAADQLSGIRGSGITATRTDLASGTTSPLAVRSSTATDLEHGFGGLAKFFPPGKPTLAAIEARLFERLGARHVFDDEYICTGGQLHELITGRDRFVADLRPLVDPAALACHPYDLCTSMLLVEAGGMVCDPWGEPLDFPLDTTSPVSWVGYANPALAARIGPVLIEAIGDVLGR